MDRHRNELVICRGFDLVERGASEADLVNDLVGGFVPDEGGGIFVPVGGPNGDGFNEFGDAGERTAAETTPGEFGEPPFDKVQPA